MARLKQRAEQRRQPIERPFELQRNLSKMPAYRSCQQSGLEANQAQEVQPRLLHHRSRRTPGTAEVLTCPDLERICTSVRVCEVINQQSKQTGRKPTRKTAHQE